MKLIRSLENRAILQKGTTRKSNNREGGFINFLRQLMAADLSLMKNKLKPLAKIVFLPLELTTAVSATDTAIQKKILGSGMTTLISSNN